MPKVSNGRSPSPMTETAALPAFENALGASARLSNAHLLLTIAKVRFFRPFLPPAAF
jgi:hypothetical protein